MSEDKVHDYTIDGLRKEIARLVALNRQATESELKAWERVKKLEAQNARLHDDYVRACERHVNRWT